MHARYAFSWYAFSAFGSGVSAAGVCGLIGSRMFFHMTMYVQHKRSITHKHAKKITTIGIFIVKFALDLYQPTPAGSTGNVLSGVVDADSSGT